MRFLSTLLRGAAVAVLLPGSAVRADIFGTGANQFTIDFVDVTNAGNANDAGAGGGSYFSNYGGVDYDYRISTFEISQNVIERAAAGGLSNVVAGWFSGDRPATLVSWYEAAAFVNWLNEDKGYQKAYNLTWNGNSWSMALWSIEASSVLDGTNRFRHKGAYYVLPGEDEWYKAAYHKSDGVTANYWDYPTMANTFPTPVAGGTNIGTAVYNGQSTAATVDQAGGFSAYGTMGQGGNVFEWIESAYDGANDSVSEGRAVRGGGWGSSENFLRSSERRNFGPTYEDTIFGFRVVAIPEPETGLWALGGFGAMLWLRPIFRRRENGGR